MAQLISNSWPAKWLIMPIACMVCTHQYHDTVIGFTRQLPHPNVHKTKQQHLQSNGVVTCPSSPVAAASEAVMEYVRVRNGASAYHADLMQQNAPHLTTHWLVQSNNGVLLHLHLLVGDT